MNNWQVVPALVRSADHDFELAALIAQTGPAAVAGFLVRDLISRCDPGQAADGVPVQLRVTTAAATVDYTVTFAAGTAQVEPGVVGEPSARVSFTIENLARILYGSPHRHRSAGWTHELLLRRPQNPDPAQVPELVRQRQRAVRAAHALLAAARGQPSLDDLAVRFGSDKWGGLHWYTPHYEMHFAPLRDEPIRLLEIGIGDYDNPHLGGGSLRMWQRYFRRGLIYGLDLFPKYLDLPRIRTIQGDQSDADFLTSLAERIGPLDIVIDDGSHVSAHVLTSFRALFPHLRDGGIYVVEDLQASYWPSYGGDAADLNSPHTSMGFLKSLVDGLNHKEYDHGAGCQPSVTDRTVVGVHFYHNLAVILKGANDECGPARRPSRSWIDVVTADR